MNTYKASTTGTYYIGVYGWNGSATYNIAVAEYPSAIDRPAPVSV